MMPKLISKFVAMAAIGIIGLTRVWPINSGAAEAQTSPAAAQAPYVLGEALETKKPRDAAREEGSYPVVDWESLVPPDWDPMKTMGEIDFSQMSDNDPRARTALRKLQDAWKNAPVNDKLDRSPIKIAGFVVPLDSRKNQTTEFLLVPYFGACIHVPPPPSNQVIHVVLPRGSKALGAMDAVWVSGTLTVKHSDSSKGSSSYRMAGDVVEPYLDASTGRPR